MTHGQQRQFMNELIENVKQGLLRDTNRIPQEWDGYELRRWIAHRFQNAIIGEMSGKRLKAYKYTLLAKNL